MIPKIIHQTAKTCDISWEERILVKKLKKILPEWEYMFWDDTKNDDLVKREFPQYWDKFNSISKGVAKADIARLMFLYTYGGFYFDTDFKILKPIPSWMLKNDQLLMISREGEDFKLGNAILASAPKGDFFGGFIDHIFNSDELNKLKENRVELVTGPEALTAYYIMNKELYKDIILIDRPIFNPPVLNHGLNIKCTKDTVGVHLCWGSWRSAGFVKAVYIYLKRKIQAVL